MSFLKAEWRKLVLVNYEVDPSILKNYLPYGTEIDLWKGKCYISVVGFMFLNTKILGIKVPFHVNFEEVNLRFYVKRKVGNQWKRGVVFIKEIVPKPALTFVANTIYNENYQTTKMDHSWSKKDRKLSIQYRWQINSNWQFIKVAAEEKISNINAGSEIEFITEHYWGYAKVNDKRTNEYEVTHQKWSHYKVLDYELSIDFKANYGASFDFLTSQDPISIILAEGSEITVENKSVIN